MIGANKIFNINLMTAASVQFLPKSVAIISHIVVNEFYVVDVLVSELIAPFHSEIVYLFHLSHRGTPPIYLLLLYPSS